MPAGNSTRTHAQGLTGEFAEFDAKDRIVGGQVMQVRELALRLQIPRVVNSKPMARRFVPNIRARR